MRPLSSRLARFIADRRGGVATMEFAVCFPVLFVIIFALFEIGWLTTRSVMLERGLDMTAREIRVGTLSGADHVELKQAVCRNAPAIANCERDLVIELVAFNPAAAYPSNQPNCVDRTGKVDPVVTLLPGQRSEIMFVRACLTVDALLPG
ncbi:MAG: TadE/TadG family type IV pilus assembly protein, partial [Pseudomonadota bacterium]